MNAKPTSRSLHRQARQALKKLFARKQSITKCSQRSDDLLGRDPDTIFFSAKNLAAEGRVSDALLSMDEVLASCPQDVRALRWARNFSREHVGLELAAKYAGRLSEIAPHDIKNEVLLADWHLATGQPEAVLQRMDALLRHQPMADQAIIRKARALIALNRAAEAVQLVSEASNSGVENVKFLSFSRNITLEHGTLAAAQQYALRIRAIATDDRKNRSTLVQCDLTLGDYEEALARADALIADYPQEPSALMLRAEALIALNRAPEALQLFGEAVDSGVEDVKFLNFARNITLEHGTLAAAREYALRIEALAPHDPKNRSTLIHCDLTLGDYEEALARADALIADYPQEPSALMLRAEALIALNRAPEAVQLISGAIDSGVEDVKFLNFARNVTLEHGTLAAARDYALRIDAIAPDDQKNRATLIQCDLTLGDFEEALARADALLADYPGELSAVMLRAQALMSLHRVAEGFQLLENALAQHAGEPRLLALLRAVALNNGFFDQAVRYAIRAHAFGTGGIFDKVLLMHAYLAAGRYDEAEQIVGPRHEPPPLGPLQKEHHHLWELRKLQKNAPVFVSAWELALANRHDRSAASAADGVYLGATMIQYWSQGTPPPDVQIVCDNWKNLFARQKLGAIEVFDRASAEVWIRENAPEFLRQFTQAFHYAMESDIFRIAYASKRPCIYMDIDSWPLEHTASILRFAVKSNSTMLYVRSSRAAIVNGFFVSTPESPFIKELVEQCLAIDLAPLAKTYEVLETSFGPSRYTKVLLDLLDAQPAASASSVEEVRGCSCVSLGQSRIYLAHEAAVACVRPPFPLGYKATNDYWKFFALPS